MGRLDAGRHGFGDLRAGSGAVAARVAAALGHSRDQGKHRLLRRIAVRAFPDRLGTGVSVGTDRRQVWPGAHADADGVVLFGVHFVKRVCGERLAACDFTSAGRHWYWRRMGDGWYVCGRRMAGASADRRRRIHAHGILLWLSAGGAGELQHWQSLWLALDVRLRRIAGAFAGVDSLWRDRTFALGAERESGAELVVVASAGDAV